MTTETTDLHKDWEYLAAYVEAGSPIGRPAALEIFYRLRAAYDEPNPQTTKQTDGCLGAVATGGINPARPTHSQTPKDAQELLEAIYDCEEHCHDSGMLFVDTNTPKQLQVIQAALTAAEQRGFERGLLKAKGTRLGLVAEIHGLYKELDTLSAEYERVKNDALDVASKHLTKTHMSSEIDGYQAAATVRELISNERGKADVVPSGDARELAERTFYEVKACIELDQAKGFDYANAISQILRALNVTATTARAEGERIGFERAMPDGWLSLVNQYQKLTVGKYKCAETIDQEATFDCPMCDGDGCVTGEQFINFDAKPLNVLFSGIGDEFIGWQKLFDDLVAMLATAPLPASEPEETDPHEGCELLQDSGLKP